MLKMKLMLTQLSTKLELKLKLKLSLAKIRYRVPKKKWKMSTILLNFQNVENTSSLIPYFSDPIKAKEMVFLSS